MDRRSFCRGSIAAGLVAAYPGFVGCQQADEPVAAVADKGFDAISLDGMETRIDEAIVRKLSRSLEGDLLMADDPQYDAARQLWNGMHDKRPTLIAQCASTDDVRRAVNFARDHSVLTAVRGGGHSWPGKSSCDGGLMIDLSRMNSVYVDTFDRRAYASGGALLNNLDTAAREHGLITTAGVVSHTGVGGFTLGGGFGRLNRKFGLTIDNLTAAEIVTADGVAHRVNEFEEPDLYWAIRGGGGNFGVVTEFEYQLHPFPLEVLSGNIVYPIEQAREILDFYVDWQRGLSDDLYVGPAMMTMPEGQGVLVMEVLYAGDPKQGEKELAPLMKIGKPLESNVAVKDYMIMQTQEDALLAHGIRSYAKSGMVKEMTKDLARAMVESYQNDPRQAVFTHTCGGAVARVDELATAFPHRNAQTMLVFASFWADPEHDEPCMTNTRKWHADLSAFMGGYYDNIDFDDTDEHVGNYGPAYERLQSIKTMYDGNNLFRLNSNIRPG